MTSLQVSVQQKADNILNGTIRHVLYGSDPVVIVESPPGAGKTYLVECASAVAACNADMSVLVVTPNVSQAYDIAKRLLDYEFPRLTVMHAKHRKLPAALEGQVTELKGWDPDAAKGVTVANAHVLAPYLQKIPQGAFDLLIIDEAFQLATSDFMPVSDFARRVLLVGDPGQLPPVVSVDTKNLEVAKHKVHWSAPKYVLDRFATTPVYGLPVTRRLVQDTARIIQPAFYPNLPFHSVVSDGQRNMGFPVAGLHSEMDQALDAIASGASLIAVTLPGTPPPHEEVDEEVARLITAISGRLLQRQATWEGERRLSSSDIGCIDPHVNAGGVLSRNFREAGCSDIVVDTAERWQGLEVPIMIVRHPLSKLGRLQPFDMEAGRWCVSLSRHQLACIIVAREAVSDTIDNYVHGCDSAAAGAADTVWQGYKAHKMIWDQLRYEGRIFSVGS